MSKTLLVTGGCGFIGSHFVRLVLSKHPDWRLVVLDNLTYAGTKENLGDIDRMEHVSLVVGDIADQSLLGKLFRKERPWGVVNFAAESHVDRSISDSAPFIHTNVLGTQALLDASKTWSVERFLQISTDEVYGDRDGKESAAEEATLLPSSPYAASKAAADLLTMAYKRTHALPVLIVRSANNYGPFQFPEKLIPLMVNKVTRGDSLPVYGDGMQRREWLYVVDNCEAILKVLLKGTIGSIYNVGVGVTHSNLDVVDSVCRHVAKFTHMGYEHLSALKQSVADRPGHDREYSMDSSKIRNDLGWIPVMSFGEGLGHTVRWYVEHSEWVEQRKAAST